MANLAWIAHCILCLVTLSHAALFSNLWAVHIEGGERKARSIAENTGFTYLGKVRVQTTNRSVHTQRCH